MGAAKDNSSWEMLHICASVLQSSPGDTAQEQQQQQAAAT
jgi:hypothetical protein